MHLGMKLPHPSRLLVVSATVISSADDQVNKVLSLLSTLKSSIFAAIFIIVFLSCTLVITHKTVC